MSAATDKTKTDQAALWSQKLAVLQAALEAGKPDAIQTIRREIEHLDSELSALANRREIVPGSLVMSIQRMEEETRKAAEERIAHQRRFLEAGAEARVAKITAKIEASSARMEQLSALLTGVKLAPREVDEGATPEQTARPYRLRDQVRALEIDGVISRRQAIAARQIARIKESISRAGQARIGRLDTAGRGSGGYREADMPEELDAQRHAVYLPWAQKLSQHNPIALDIVDKVASQGISLDKVRKKHHVDWETARAKLCDALDEFAEAAEAYSRECEPAAEGATS